MSLLITGQKAPETATIIQAISIPLGCLPELDDKIIAKDPRHLGYKIYRKQAVIELDASSLLARFHSAGCCYARY